MKANAFGASLRFLGLLVLLGLTVPSLAQDNTTTTNTTLIDTTNCTVDTRIEVFID